MKGMHDTMSVDAYRRLLEYQEAQERKAKRKAGASSKGHPESELQRACVRWFRTTYPDHAPLLFAVGNGGKRSAVEAGIMQAEGVTPGVSDLILLEARGCHGALCIEMKTTARSSRQSERQKAWQEATEKAGNLYTICRTREEFETAVNDYMALPWNAIREK